MFDASRGWALKQTASDLRLYFVMQTAAQRLKKFADQRLQRAARVSTAQAAVLTLIEASEPMTQREISRKLHQRESAVTTMVARLLKLELIERVRAPDDQRAWALTLTASGHTALKEARAAFDEVNERLSSTLDERALRELATALHRVNAALSEEDT